MRSAGPEQIRRLGQALRIKWTRYIPHEPHPKQQAFLWLNCKEAFFGGAGGGGKSDALLMGALQYVDVPGYAAIIFRRTYTDLALPGALMDRAKDWLAGTDARWSDKTVTFPSGAKITFAYMENEEDKRRYASAEFQYVAFDELTHFSETQYRFLFSRLRKTQGFPVPLRMRSASNPGSRGHEWVRRRFVDPRTRRAGAVFVPARMEDNPSLDVAAYRESLAEVDPLERARIEAGDWDAIKGGRFLKEWLRRYELRSGGVYGKGEYQLMDPRGEVTIRKVQLVDCWRFLTVDPAASAEETAKTADPDYTVISAWAVTPFSELIWLDCHRFKKEIPDIVPEIEGVYSLWRPAYVAIEAVAANKAVLQYALRTNMTVQEVSPMGKDKLVRATKATVMAKGGKLYLPLSAHWLEDAEMELLLFTGNDKQDAHDDVVDALSYAAAAVDEWGSPGGGEPMTLGQRAY